MSYDSAVLADHPIAYWKCNETAPPPPAPNTSLIDYSGFGNHGTLQPNSVAGLVQGTVGPIVTDLSTNFCLGGGIGRIPSLGNNSGVLFQTGTQTWEVWFQRPDPDPSDGVHILMNRGGDTTNTYFSVAQRSTGNYQGQLISSFDWNNVFAGTLSCVVTPNEWHVGHLLYDADNATMYEYLDTWLTDITTGCPAPPLTDNNPWRIGYATNLVFGPVFRNYLLARVACYPSLLSPLSRINRSIEALGFRLDNPCGATVTLGCPSPSSGAVGVNFTATMAITNGTPPYTFSLVDGAIPDGLTLNTTTGEISGKPTTPGTFNFTILVVDSVGLDAISIGCGIVIGSEPPIVINPPIADTFVFGEGTTGSRWYIAAQLSDSGDNLRDKVTKALAVTGRGQNTRVEMFNYGPEEDINVENVEDGVNSKTGKVDVPPCTQVQRSARIPLNVANSLLHTFRLEGEWDGTGEPDRIDEVEYEVGEQGVRR